MLHARSASVDITPQTPVRLAGFGNQRPQPFDRINDPLEVNAIALEAGGKAVTFLSFDTLSVGSRVDRLARRLFGENCITLASHTHFAPSLDAELPSLGGVDDAYVGHVEKQLEHLRDRLDQQEPRAAALSLGQVAAPFAVNRRRRAFGLDGKVKMRTLPNPHGPKDDTATVLLLNDAGSGAPVAVLWSYACHPVSFHDANAVSSDFCGVVRGALRARFGDGTPCVFAQGFCGDVRPPSYGIGAKTPRNIARYAVKRLLQGPCFGDFTRPQWEAWAGTLAKTVASIQMDRLDGAETLDVVRAELPLAELHRSPAPDFGMRRGLECARVRLGGELEVWALSGEPVGGIAGLLPKPGGTRIAAGYAGHMFGYLPTSAMLAEGGYEAEDFRPAFALPGAYRPDISDRLAAFFATLK